MSPPETLTSKIITALVGVEEPEEHPECNGDGATTALMFVAGMGLLAVVAPLWADKWMRDTIINSL